MKTPVLLSALLSALSACGSSASQAISFPATPLTTVVSDAGAYAIAIYSSPQPPIRGLVAFKYVVTYSDGGAPADDLSVAVVPFMPQMNHGTSIQPTVDAGAAGAYEVDDVYLFMPGEFQLQTTLGGTVPDSLVPTFSVD